MKLKHNKVGIIDLAYPEDKAFEASSMYGTTPYQAPNIKLQLASDADYDAVYKYFAVAGVLPEYVGPHVTNKSTPQAPYYRTRRIIHFSKRESIVKAIEVLKNLNLIPDDESGEQLLAYQARMRDPRNYDNDCQTKQLLDWQLSNCALRLSPAELKAKLLDNLRNQLEGFSSKSYYSQDEVQQRREYISLLEAAIKAEGSGEKLIRCIEGGRQQFNKDKYDFGYVLMRVGEDYIQQWHVDNMKVYRREAYLPIILAKEALSIRKARGSSFNYEVTGDNALAFKYYRAAINTVGKEYLGPPEAYYQLAVMYRLDIVPSEEEGKDNNKMSVYYYEQAAQRGHKTSLLKLGKMHMLGHGVPEADSGKAIFYLKQVIGTDIHLWESEALEYVLSMVDSGKKPAIEYLQEMLEYHKAEVLEKLPQILALFKKDGIKQFSKTASSFRYGKSYVLPPRALVDVGIEHLQQLHYLADSGRTDYTYRHKGYVLAKEMLVNVYEELAKSCAGEGIENNFSDTALAYRSRIEKQIEEEKPKEKTPEELLIEAVENDDVKGFILHLKKQSLTVDFRVYSDETPLICHAASCGSLKVVRYLLKNGVEVTARENNYSKKNALMSVCTLGLYTAELRLENRLQIAALLIEIGVDVNAGEGKEYTALHKATLSEFDDMVLLLIKHGAIVDSRDMSKQTPLSLLIDQYREGASLSTIELLLMAGADINAHDSIGVRPWTQATYYPAIKSLLASYQHPDKTLSKFEKEASALEAYARGLGLTGGSSSDVDSHASNYMQNDRPLKPRLSMDALQHQYAQQAFRKAIAIFKEGNLDSAILHFNSANRYFKQNSREKALCCKSLGNIYIDKEAYFLARKYFHESALICQNLVKSREASQSELGATKALFDSASKLVEADKVAREGLTLLKEENYTAAADQFTQAISQHREVQKESNLLTVYYYNLGSCHDRQGNVGDAIKFTDIALRMRQRLLGFHHKDTNKARKKVTVLREKLKQTSTKGSSRLNIHAERRRMDERSNAECEESSSSSSATIPGAPT